MTAELASDTSDAPATKAAGFNTTVETIRGVALPSLFDRMVQALPPDTRALVLRKPPAVQWLPIRHFSSLVETAMHEAFAGELRRVTEVARLSIGSDLNTIYRVFIRFSSAEFVLERAAKLFSTYNRNNGGLTVRKIDSKTIDLVYAGQQCTKASYFAYHKGAIWAVVDALGLKDAAIVDGLPGPSEDAIFRVTWA